MSDDTSPQTRAKPVGKPHPIYRSNISSIEAAAFEEFWSEFRTYLINEGSLLTRAESKLWGCGDIWYHLHLNKNSTLTKFISSITVFDRFIYHDRGFILFRAKLNSQTSKQLIGIYGETNAVDHTYSIIPTCDYPACQFYHMTRNIHKPQSLSWCTLQVKLGVRPLFRIWFLHGPPTTRQSIVCFNITMNLFCLLFFSQCLSH